MPPPLPCPVPPVIAELSNNDVLGFTDDVMEEMGQEEEEVEAVLRALEGFNISNEVGLGLPITGVVPPPPPLTAL